MIVCQTLKSKNQSRLDAFFNSSKMELFVKPLDWGQPVFESGKCIYLVQVLKIVLLFCCFDVKMTKKSFLDVLKSNHAMK